MWTATQRPTPSVGLHDAVPFHDYIAWNAMNFHTLEHGRRSMRHLYHAANGPPHEPTDPMDFGRAFHTAVLEPEQFARCYVVEPQYPRAGNNHLTAEGKRIKEQFRAQHADADEFIDRDEHGRICTMAEAVRQHPAARKLLMSAGRCEIAAVWDDPQTGVRCKGRLDKFLPGVMALDLKTTRNASWDEFGRDIWKFGYHRQIAFYSAGFAAASGEPTEFVIVAIESEPPHCVAVYTPDDTMMQAGKAEVRVLLTKYAEAMRTGEWAGYSDKVEPISLPAWAARGMGGL